MISLKRKRTIMNNRDKSVKRIKMFFVTIIIIFLLGFGYYVVVKLRIDETKTIKVNGIEIKTAQISLQGNIAKLHIEYPYLDDYSDEIACKINEQIYQMIVTQDLFQYKDYMEEIDITYEVTFVNSEILSILFSGYISSRGGYTDYDKALNFSISSGELLSIGDFYENTEIKQLLIKATENGSLLVEDIPLTDEEIKEYLYSHFIEAFDTNYMDKTDNFYFKDEKMYFIGESVESMRQNVHVVWREDNDSKE